MRATRLAISAGLLMAGLAAAAAPASAQTNGNIELGASLLNLSIVKPSGSSSSETLFGIPSATFGLAGSGVYATFFADPHIGIEPQLGLLMQSGGGETYHLINLTAQVDYFTRGNAESSPYFFGSVGVIDISESQTNPKIFGAGVGYRARMGGRLVVRVDGRYNHFTDNGGNAVAFTVSIGGLFGR